VSTLWLHCGAHKTASTSLQQVLGRVQAELQHLGYHYVAPGAINRAALPADLHAPLGENDAGRTERVRRFFAPLAALHENVLVSHESLLSFAYASPDPRQAMRFYGTVPNALARLLQSEAFDRVILILYIRRQDHYLESLFFEELKQGSFFPTFEDYLEFRKPEEVSWFGLVEAFEQFVSPGNIVLRPFESVTFGSEAFLRGFLEIFGWPPSWDVPKLPRLNARPTGLALRLHSRLARRLDREQRKWLALCLFRALNRRGLRPARPADDEQDRRILAHHAEGNRSVFARMPRRFQSLLSAYHAAAAGPGAANDKHQPTSG